VLQITEKQVRELLPMGECVARMRECFAALGRGTAVNVARRRLFLPTGTVMHQLAGAWGGYLGTKIYTTNVKRGAMYFHVLLYDAASAEPLALIEANHLGQIRTGAASGVATELLAPADVSAVALIGTGFQAWTQLEAVLGVRRAAAVRVYSRKPEKRESFAARASAAWGVEVTAAATAEACVRGAQVVITSTYAKEPVLASEWVEDGAHVNATGSNQADRREIPAELVRRAELVAVDSLEQARIEAGDLLLAVPEGEWGQLPLMELGPIAADAGFRRPGGVTIFKSLGLGVQDVAAAALVYDKLTGKAA
jgi:ornithine cyclodeaminase/alanine dehydrogenase-like protein (mu-crystallin family)